MVPTNLVSIEVVKSASNILDRYFNVVETFYKENEKELNFEKADLATSLIQNYFSHMGKKDIELKMPDGQVVPPTFPGIPKDKPELSIKDTSPIEVREYILKDCEEVILPQVNKILEEEGNFIPIDASLMISHSIEYMINYYVSNNILPVTAGPTMTEVKNDG